MSWMMQTWAGALYWEVGEQQDDMNRLMLQPVAQ
jgi:hypothetical protein